MVFRVSITSVEKSAHFLLCQIPCNDFCGLYLAGMLLSQWVVEWKTKSCTCMLSAQPTTRQERQFYAVRDEAGWITQLSLTSQNKHTTPPAQTVMTAISGKLGHTKKQNHSCTETKFCSNQGQIQDLVRTLTSGGKGLIEIRQKKIRQ